MSIVERLSVLVALFLLHCIIVEPYGTGAPDSVCGSMVPGHRQTIQSSAPPFTISPNTTETFGGGRVIVKIESNPDSFRGFLIQARDSTDKSMGVFFTGVHKTLTCGNSANSAVTHMSADAKDTVTLEWEAPSDFQGDVTFTATIVKEYTTYWVNVRSAKVGVQKRSVESGSGTDSVPSTNVPNKKIVSGSSSGIPEKLSDLYTGCGVTKSCYGFGTNNKCVDSKSCKFMVTYTDAGNDQYEFELMGRKTSDRHYIAVGLSMDAHMGSDGVVSCNNENGVIDVQHTWNEGHGNIVVEKPKDGLTVLKTADLDGNTYCRFLRDVKTKVRYTNFDLALEKYFIMIATGTIDADGNLVYHSGNKIVSARPVALGVTSNVEGRNTRLPRVIHACLMIAAWVSAASCGILFARYYKKTWVRFKLCNIDQWFHCHRFFMITTWCLTIAAFVVIVVELTEFRLSTHSIVGVISIGLCFIQPFMAALRPGPNGKNRSLFNWAHWLVGNVAQILAITAIFFGFELFMMEDNDWLKKFAWYVIVAFIAFHCLTHIILSIAQCITDKKTNEVGDVFPLKNFDGSRAPLQPEDKASDAPLAGFRKFVLAIYLILNWSVTALLILVVVFKRHEIEEQLEAWNFPAFWEHSE